MEVVLFLVVNGTGLESLLRGVALHAVEIQQVIERWYSGWVASRHVGRRAHAQLAQYLILDDFQVPLSQLFALDARRTVGRNIGARLREDVVLAVAFVVVFVVELERRGQSGWHRRRRRHGRRRRLRRQVQLTVVVPVLRLVLFDRLRQSVQGPVLVQVELGRLTAGSRHRHRHQAQRHQRHVQHHRSPARWAQAHRTVAVELHPRRSVALALALALATALPSWSFLSFLALFLLLFFFLSSSLWFDSIRFDWLAVRWPVCFAQKHRQTSDQWNNCLISRCWLASITVPVRVSSSHGTDTVTDNNFHRSLSMTRHGERRAESGSTQNRNCKWEKNNKTTANRAKLIYCPRYGSQSKIKALFSCFPSISVIGAAYSNSRRSFPLCRDSFSLAQHSDVFSRLEDFLFFFFVFFFCLWS